LGCRGEWYAVFRAGKGMTHQIEPIDMLWISQAYSKTFVAETSHPTSLPERFIILEPKKSKPTLSGKYFSLPSSSGTHPQHHSAKAIAHAMPAAPSCSQILRPGLDLMPIVVLVGANIPIKASEAVGDNAITGFGKSNLDRFTLRPRLPHAVRHPALQGINRELILIIYFN
jgi:hypothetical protein